jgi:hypothetical protein
MDYLPKVLVLIVEDYAGVGLELMRRDVLPAIKKIDKDVVGLVWNEHFIQRLLMHEDRRLVEELVEYYNGATPRYDRRGYSYLARAPCDWMNIWRHTQHMSFSDYMGGYVGVMNPLSDVPAESARGRRRGQVGRRLH